MSKLESPPKFQFSRCFVPPKRSLLFTSVEIVFVPYTHSLANGWQCAKKPPPGILKLYLGIYFTPH